MGDGHIQKTWKEYFEDPFNVDTEKWVAVNVWFSGFNGVRRGNYFGGKPVNWAEV